MIRKNNANEGSEFFTCFNHKKVPGTEPIL